MENPPPLQPPGQPPEPDLAPRYFSWIIAPIVLPIFGWMALPKFARYPIGEVSIVVYFGLSLAALIATSIWLAKGLAARKNKPFDAGHAVLFCLGSFAIGFAVFFVSCAAVALGSIGR